jgi:hypothetical protein
VFNLRALAASEHVEKELLDEWDVSKPKLAAECDRSATVMGPKVRKCTFYVVGEADALCLSFKFLHVPF